MENSRRNFIKNIVLTSSAVGLIPGLVKATVLTNQPASQLKSGSGNQSDIIGAEAYKIFNSGELGTINTVQIWTDSTTIPFTKNKFCDYELHPVTELFQLVLAATKKQPLSVDTTAGSFSFNQIKSKSPDTILSVFDMGTFHLIWENVISKTNRRFGFQNGVAFVGSKKTLVSTREKALVIGQSKSKAQLLNTEQKELICGIRSEEYYFSDLTENSKRKKSDIDLFARAKMCVRMAGRSYFENKKIHWSSSIN